MNSWLVKQMTEKQGITKHMKAEKQMLWVGRMNNIRCSVKEQIDAELIYC